MPTGYAEADNQTSSKYQGWVPRDTVHPKLGLSASTPGASSSSHVGSVQVQVAGARKTTSNSQAAPVHDDLTLRLLASALQARPERSAKLRALDGGRPQGAQVQVERGTRAHRVNQALGRIGQPRLPKHCNLSRQEAADLDNAHASPLRNPACCTAIDDHTAPSLPGGLAHAVAPPADGRHSSAGGASSRLTLAGLLNIPPPSTWRLFLIPPIRAYEAPTGRADVTSPTRCLPARSASTCPVDQEEGADTWMTKA